jgi:hypothetical protein
MSDRDYYESLGLTPLADGAMVDQAYWHLARKYQSLGTSHPSAAHMLDELNEAYGVLGNPRLRREYDAFRDDVLLASGVVSAVPAKPKRAKKSAEAHAEKDRGNAWSPPRIANWRWYGLSAIIAGLALAGAWQGVNLVFVIAALAGGLALSLTPALKRQVAALSFAMPNVNLSDVKAPKLTLPKMPEFANRPEPDESLDTDELRASTAAIISRWRQSMGLRAPEPRDVHDADAPSKTLVEIVEAEHDLESETEPLTTVMDILRGHKTASSGEPTVSH